jgi:hypothetical protein
VLEAALEGCISKSMHSGIASSFARASKKVVSGKADIVEIFVKL